MPIGIVVLSWNAFFCTCSGQRRPPQLAAFSPADEFFFHASEYYIGWQRIHCSAIGLISQDINGHRRFQPV